MTASPAPVPGLISVNLAGVTEQASVGANPYRIDADGRPYVPSGDGGIALGVRLGDGVFDHVGDHLAPGACLTHPDQAAGHALVAQSCIGNVVTVRSGRASGEVGVVTGKRGEGGRVIVTFTQEVLSRLRPGDQVAVRGRGQGMPDLVPGVAVRNIDPFLLSLLPVTVAAPGSPGSAGAGGTAGAVVEAGVSAVLPSRVVGNGIGRPTPMWDLDLQLTQANAEQFGAAGLRLGDLVAITDIDARFNAGYRRGWISVGLVVHGSSPQPGHGPGVTVILSGPADAIVTHVDATSHRGLREETVLEVASDDR